MKEITLDDFKLWGAKGGNIGGRSKSAKKAKAARENGKLGGNPGAKSKQVSKKKVKPTRT